MKHLKPSFFIIGERKCGTSSLYRYLLDHPGVLPCKQKEPQFFVKKPWRILWQINQYYRLFPTIDYQGDIRVEWPELDAKGHLYTETFTVERKKESHYITGEASAETFFRGHPRLLKFFLPNIKLILMLRNPVQRTYSHYRMLERFRREGRKTSVAVGSFALDMKNEMDMIRKGRPTFFISPSIYINRLPLWHRIFGKENLLIVRTEDLKDPLRANDTMQQICTYLNLPNYQFGSILSKQYNKAPRQSIPEGLEEELTFFFRPYNLALEDYLGRKMNWG